MPPLWRPGGPWDGPGTLGGTRKDTLRSRPKLSLIFGGLGTPFLELLGFIFLMFFVSESGCLGLENQAFGLRGIAKNNFRRSWNLMILESIFHDFK